MEFLRSLILYGVLLSPFYIFMWFLWQKFLSVEAALATYLHENRGQDHVKNVFRLAENLLTKNMEVMVGNRMERVVTILEHYLPS